MQAKKCASCGALVKGMVCYYCGSFYGAPGDMENQKRALEEYHALLRTQEIETRTRLLKRGFLPDSGKLLIEAGLMCVSIMDEMDFECSLSDVASRRLEAINMKLQLLSQDRETARAALMLIEKSRRYSDRANKDSAYSLITAGVIILIIASGLWYFLSR